MTKSIIKLAKRYHRRSVDTRGSIEDDNLTAHAAARVLLSLRTNRTRVKHTSATPILEFVGERLDVPVAMLVADIEAPTNGELAAVAAALFALDSADTALNRKLSHLCAILNLDEIDVQILNVFAHAVRAPAFRNFLDLIDIGASCTVMTVSALALLTGIEPLEVEKRLARQGPLTDTNLIEDHKDGEYATGDMLRGIVSCQGDTLAEVERFILPDTEHSMLTWDDFDHLGPARELAAKILQAGKPVSILLYGEPGTGKSEFARVLARHVGRGASFAGVVGDHDDEEPDRRARLGHLGMLRRICAMRNDRVVVVDEADDVLVISHHRRASKQFINRLVEDPKTSTIWIVNNPGALDDASVRRMVLAVHFEPLPVAVRARIASHVAETEGVPLMKDEVNRLAALPANAAVIASGISAAGLSGGGAEAAQEAVTSILQAMGQASRPANLPEGTYDAALSCADIDLADLARSLGAAPAQGWSLLLAGPSGTGKTAFARHLAERIGIELMVKRPSDLLSPFVGQTEARIA